MAKITTDDCKKFIADFQSRNQIERARFDVDNPRRDYDFEENMKMVESTKNPKNWIRIYKKRPSDEEDYRYYVDGANLNRYAEEQAEIDMSKIEWERAFELKDSEMAVAYMLYELKDGTLLLGNFIGD